MSEITEKVLRSGLIDTHVADLMERFGMLPEGSAALAATGMAVPNMTRTQMVKLAEELAEAVEREHAIRETSLDLDRLRWPARVGIWDQGARVSVVIRVDCLIDRLGRYYFRPQDVKLDWFVPGRQLLRGHEDSIKEMITEVQELYAGEQVAAIQVSTVPA